MTASPARCPVCDEMEAEIFLHRTGVPVHQNLIMRSAESARAIARGDLALAVCGRCGFVFNTAFDLTRLSYGEAYDNTQSCSPSFDTYLDGLVENLVFEQGVRGARIVEVGCGKGSFLQKLVANPAVGNTGIGFDPTYVGPDSLLDGRLRFERRFYDESCAQIPADVVVCRHVIEHVPDPVALLRSVRTALGESEKARIFFETPCVEWILRNQVVWDFFYEHCSLFTAQSLTTAFERAGLRVHAVHHVFGGQYLWLEARIAEDEPSVSYHPGELPALARAYAEAERAHAEEWRQRVAELRRYGGVALWGAGAKGVTLANLIDPTRDSITCVVDLNPQKQGQFLPGTGHPIVDFRDLPARGVASAILMNPNYQAENRGLLRDAGLDITLISHES